MLGDDMAVLTAVAAVITSDGRVLVCQRRKGTAFELQWEFPGGKVAAGESCAAALERELREELGVEARIGEEIYRTRHRYAELDRELELIFYGAALDSASIRNLAFERMEWVKPEDLGALAFLPADRELVGKIACGEIKIR